MHRIVKTFMLWLLLAALPLQGFAAAMQLSCAPMSHHVAAPAAAHEHHGAALHAAAQPAPADHAAMTAHAGSSCSACAACCLGALALPAGAIATPVYSTSLPAVATSLPRIADFIPGGPERPPKPVIA